MMRKIEQSVNESRREYLGKMRRWIVREYQRLIDGEYRHCHNSHPASLAMRKAEEIYIDSGTFGTEGDSDLDLTYLNSGENYELTIVFRKGRFTVDCVGDLMQRLQNE